jgi:hypothetical protein
MVIWPKAVTGHRKYEGILLICKMRFPMLKILASMKMNGSITNSSRSTNARLCFSVRQRGFLFQQLKTQFTGKTVLATVHILSEIQLYQSRKRIEKVRTKRKSKGKVMYRNILVGVIIFFMVWFYYFSIIFF